MSKILKRAVIILLIFNLMCANANMAILGLISYATGEEGQEELAQEEQVKELEIEISEFYKNKMAETETKYSEKITLNFSNETNFDKVIISDEETKINEKTAEEVEAETESETETQSEQENGAETELAEEVKITYNSTVINKQDLISKIGEQGSLKIEYTMYEGQNGVVEINNQTPANPDGSITIVYPENTKSVDITITTDTKEINDLAIKHEKIIEKVTDLDKVNILKTSKKLSVKAGEQEVANIEEVVENRINYTKTVAELGLDKNQISTLVENEVNFTVTLKTETEAYDLFKNPEFTIELPKEITKASIKTNGVEIVNSNLTIATAETKVLENGNQAIYIKLDGEQVEHTNTDLENTQITIKASLETEKLIPTLVRAVNLHYTNENVTTYDGVTKGEEGIDTKEITLVSESEIIVETKAEFEDKIFSSLRDNYITVIVEPETYTETKITGTAINNTEEDIDNAKILGTATNIGELTVATDGNYVVYYTEKADAGINVDDTDNGWSTTYSANAKKYLIVIEKFEKGKTITFNYKITLPEAEEVQVSHDVKFDVYKGEDIKTSKITILQEAKDIEVIENEIIKAEITYLDENPKQLGDRLVSRINITNLSSEDLENIDMQITIPQGFTNITIVSIDENDEYETLLHYIDDNNVMNVQDVSLASGKSVIIQIGMDIEEFVKSSVAVVAQVKYGDKEQTLSKAINIVEPSTIKTTITSNKLGKTLEENEEIEYVITLENIGESNSIIDITIPELKELKINSLNILNVTKSENVLNVISNNISRKIYDVEINSGEKLEIRIKGTVQDLEESTKIQMYLDIKGITIIDTVTDTLENHIKVAAETPTPGEGEDGDTDKPGTGEEGEGDKPGTGDVEKPGDGNEGDQDKPVTPTEEPNKIFGVAWIDANENGIKDENELLLKDIQAILINSVTSEQVEAVVTNNDGEYEFKDIKKGTYVVEFKFNTSTFRVTDYQKGIKQDDIDSDVITSTQNDANTTKTEVIELGSGMEKDINIGLIVKEKFDMSISNRITKVTVTNTKGTNTYNFEKADIAKVEIEEDYMKGSLVLVEYEITISNNGEVAGYVKEVVNQLPEGMEFSSELNTNWYEGNDGKLYSAAIENEKIEPKETRTLKLVLTKEMKESKVESTINTSEIGETFNEYLIEDKEEENDISDATIIVSIKTGGIVSYMWLILVVITIIGSGLFGTIKIMNKEVKK